MSIFTPTELPVEEQRATLTTRLRELENQRIVAGLELEAVNGIEASPEREDAIAQDKANYEYAVEGLDERIKVYRAALAKIADAVVQSG